ncbi:hypothetical protein PROFUN_00818 [Planoprotostelium fungivorum]|uniref:EF-hand domain-containing protein n=1 Tax=Planoprotostelium fungivorum TaxID=1890364 RepID=A0A2P6P035_9EUKA|nr:hypothetical protein PROFUN_00818 [Planoprotostelium fungivorum]
MTPNSQRLTLHLALLCTIVAASLPFQDDGKCTEAKEMKLDDVRYVRMEEAIKGMKLDGWEEEWISSGRTSHKFQKVPKIDFVYTWVNGSDPYFTETESAYAGVYSKDRRWQKNHKNHRWNELDELRYGIRSVWSFAQDFLNNLFIIVNEVWDGEKWIDQVPSWFNSEKDNERVKIIGTKQIFREEAKDCLPTFNSNTIETQLHNTRSSVDIFVALSNDMMLGTDHSASDFYSPLFGLTLGFGYETPPNRQVPFSESEISSLPANDIAIGTSSFMLSRLFGIRTRLTPYHFGHVMSRSLTHEAFHSFPQLSLTSSLSRYRNDATQMDTWFLTSHYVMERFREALLWSYLSLRMDSDGNGIIDLMERKAIIKDIIKVKYQPGYMRTHRQLHFEMDEVLHGADLPPTMAETIRWTSMDGPVGMDVQCQWFNPETCFSHSDVPGNITIERALDNFVRSNTQCGDCTIQRLLQDHPRGYEPLLPPREKVQERDMAIKAIRRYQYSVVPNSMSRFVSLKGEMDVPLLKKRGGDIKDSLHSPVVPQYCFNDDLNEKLTEEMVERTKQNLWHFYESIASVPTPFEKRE